VPEKQMLAFRFLEKKTDRHRLYRNPNQSYTQSSDELANGGAPPDIPMSLVHLPWYSPIMFSNKFFLATYGNLFNVI
jgi:hypothetical protein